MTPALENHKSANAESLGPVVSSAGEAGDRGLSKQRVTRSVVANQGGKPTTARYRLAKDIYNEISNQLESLDPDELGRWLVDRVGQVRRNRELTSPLLLVKDEIERPELDVSQ